MPKVRPEMLSVSSRIDVPSSPQPAEVLPGKWRDVLNALRMTALGCRAAARTDLFEACALIVSTQNKARDAFSQALIRCLHEAINSRPVFFQPGTVEVSFDEAWLLRAIIASHGRDVDSLAFLIRSRVPKVHQRQIAFLIKGIADQFPHT